MKTKNFLHLQEEKDIILKDIETNILIIEKQELKMVEECSLNIKIEEEVKIYGIQ